MAKAPDVSVVLNHISDFEKISSQKPPTRVFLSKSILEQTKSDATLQGKIKGLMAKNIKVEPALKGRNAEVYIPPPKQNPNQLSKPLTGYRLQDLKTRSLTSAIYSTPRPRPLRGLVATVFGATGFLGTQVVQALANRGAQVVCPVRQNICGMHPQFQRDQRALRMYGEQGQVFPIQYNPSNFEDLCTMVNRSQLVFNCTGMNHNYANSYDAFGLEGVFSNLPRNIARACTMRGVQRFVHVSHVNADPGSDNDFFRFKAWGERGVMEEFPNSIIVRPTDMFGHGDNFLRWMLDVWCRNNWPVKGRSIFLLKDREYVETEPVWVVDVARAMIRGAMRESCFGETLELGGPAKYRLIELFRYVEALYHITPSDIKLLSPLEAKIRFENKPTMTLARTWMDLHLRQDVLANPQAKSWEEVEVDRSDLQKVENIAGDACAAYEFYETKTQTGLRADKPPRVLGSLQGSKVSWSQLLSLFGLGAFFYHFG